MDLTIPIVSDVERWAGIIIGLAFVAFKKEILEWIRESWKKSHNWLRNWSQRRDFVVQVTTAQVKVIRDSGLEELEASLYFLLEEYKADRVSITEYTDQPDGGALATCLVQARLAEMKSVRNLQNTPISQALYYEIKSIQQMPHRIRYVPDAQLEEVAALRGALLNAGACSAFYQVISQPTMMPIRLLAFSWQKPHELTQAQLNLLRFSGILCSNVLSNLDKWKPTSTD